MTGILGLLLLIPPAIILGSGLPHELPCRPGQEEKLAPLVAADDTTHKIRAGTYNGTGTAQLVIIRHFHISRKLLQPCIVHVNASWLVLVLLKI